MQLAFDFDLPEVVPAAERPRKEEIELLPLNGYDHVILNLSAGADSMGCLFHLMQAGLDLSKLEIWHQCVDGHGDTYREFWDWPCTESYIESVGEYFKIPVYYQWRGYGLHGELLRENRMSHDVYYQEGESVVRLKTTRAKISTRKKFPARSANLAVRWCSSAGKADPAVRCLNNNPRFQGELGNPIKVLFVTGERRAEGGNRANYLKQELHGSSSRRRIVHHFRPVIDATKEEMFDLHREFGILPHPAYYLGFGRVSCMGCIFSTKHHWKTIEHIANDRYQAFVKTEELIGHTIDHKLSLPELAAGGQLEKVLPLDDPHLSFWLELAMKKDFSVEDLMIKEWVRPIGASRGCDGGPI